MAFKPIGKTFEELKPLEVEVGGCKHQLEVIKDQGANLIVLTPSGMRCVTKFVGHGRHTFFVWLGVKVWDDGLKGDRNNGQN